MSKNKSSQKKVSLSELNNHAISNKRQAMKDLKMLDFDELQYKNGFDLKKSNPFIIICDLYHLLLIIP